MSTQMAREIAQIPQVVAQLLAEQTPAIAQIAAELRAAAPHVVLTVARGSSDHVATYFKYVAELALGVPVASVGPSVASIYGRALQLPQGACLAISQSGASPDIIAMAEASGPQTIALTNAPGSPLAQACAHVVPICAGPEHSVAATKTFVTSAVAAAALVAHWAQDSALIDALSALPDRLDAALRQDWSPLAQMLHGHESLIVLGRGPGFAMAHEAALKFKETSMIHAEAYSSAEVLHGPAAIVGPRIPVLALSAADAAAPRLAEVAARLAAQGAPVCATAPGIAGVQALPSAEAGHPLLAPLSLITSFYVAVESLARARGYDPDTPRHLQKVTQTQ